jgi:four helix bundle protein
MTVDSALIKRILLNCKATIMTNYKNLESWKKSMLLVKDVYQLVTSFPKEELYVLTAQLKRSAVSIPCNIAEGVGRNYKKDTIQFLHVSRGSVYETETLLNIAVMVEIISENDFAPFSDKIDECLRILNGLITYYENSNLK